jgi:hypothetical protein
LLKSSYGNTSNQHWRGWSNHFFSSSILATGCFYSAAPFRGAWSIHIFRDINSMTNWQYSWKYAMLCLPWQWVDRFSKLNSNVLWKFEANFGGLYGWSSGKKFFGLLNRIPNCKVFSWYFSTHDIFSDHRHFSQPSTYYPGPSTYYPRPFVKLAWDMHVYTHISEFTIQTQHNAMFILYITNYLISQEVCLRVFVLSWRMNENDCWRHYSCSSVDGEVWNVTSLHEFIRIRTPG